MNTDNLLDCIAHETTHEEFLATFDGDVYAAARHLRDFYVEALEEQGADVPDDDELDELQRNTANALR
jgi:hypothetical protein